MSQTNTKLRICLVGSAGGHLTQLLKLADCWDGYDTFSIATSEMVAHSLQKYGNVYIVPQCDRRHPLKMLKLLSACMIIVARQKPQAVISTGAAAGCITCFLGKMTGAKVIWIDSIANVERLSLSGRMVRYIADLFFVQWPELTAKYTNVQFAGTLV